MTTSTYRPNYEPSRGFVVRVAFYANGRNFKNGDRFDPRDAECDDRRLRQLWDARYIDCLAADALPAGSEQPTRGAEMLAPAPVTSDQSPPASSGGEVLNDLEASAHE